MTLLCTCRDVSAHLLWLCVAVIRSGDYYMFEYGSDDDTDSIYEVDQADGVGGGEQDSSDEEQPAKLDPFQVTTPRRHTARPQFPHTSTSVACQSLP